MNPTIEMLRHFLTRATTRPWGVKSDEPGTVWVLDDSGAPYCRLADCRPGGEANAHLIAAMFDHLPALLDVAEAAQELRDCWHESTMCIVDPPCRNCKACRFVAAVAKLGMVPNVIGDEK